MKKETSALSAQAKIGTLIKSLREKKGLTQTEFADMLQTSQSAVARIESGAQNLTTKEIEKISSALESKLVRVADESEDLEIVGGKKLSGSVETNTSKNGALALMAASLLNYGETTLHGIPRNEEVFRFIELFTSLGIKVDWMSEKTLRIKRPEKLDLANINKDIFVKIRVGLYLLPILLHENTSFTLPNPGGCKMGERTISAHKFALEEFGVSILSKEKTYDISWKNKKFPEEVVMYESSDTGTVSCLLLSAYNSQEVKISFAPPNYQVQDVCFFLEKLGVKLAGIGTTDLKITGVSEKINLKIEHHNSEDPIESMFFISAAAVTHSHITITRCPIEFLKLELLKLSKMGLVYKLSKKYFSHNGKTILVDIDIYGNKSTFTAAQDKIHCQPYPGINVDNLPFFVPIAALAEGTTLVHDWMWENRALYFTELNRLGANIKLADPHRVFITGVEKLKAGQVVCPPALRPATIILVAMLAAKGTSVLRNIYSIKRGYENLIERLQALGADVRVRREF